MKSGFAIAVALRGPASAPAIVARRVVELSDPDVAETRQPYHHGFYTHETDLRAIAGLVKIVERCADRSVDTLLADEAFAGCRSAALVVGQRDRSGSRSPTRTFGRTRARGGCSACVLESALQAHGIRCDVIVEKELGARAAAGLGRRGGDIARTVARFGKDAGGPWRADEKAASTAAWLLLA